MTGSAPTQRQGFVARVKAWKVKRKSRPSAQDDQIQQTAGGELSSDQARSAQSTAASPPAVSIVTTSPTDVPDVRVDPNTSDPNPHRDETDAAPECSSTGPVNAPDLWLEAFDQVDDETKKLINENPILTDNTAQIDELTTMVKDKVERFKDDSWKITINGKERTWSANGQRVIAGIQDVGNIVIAFAPEPASTIWSAVKVLLSTHASQCKDVVAILGCAEKVLPIIKRAKIYENLYLQSMGDSLRDTLLAVYREVIKLLAYTGDYLSKIGAARFFEALKHPGKGEEFLKSLTDAESRLNSDTQACIAVNLEQAINHIQQMRIPLRLIDGRIAEVHEYVREHDLKFALNYVSRIETGKQHERRLESRLQGTGEWLFQHENFQEWESSNSSSFLWLTGQVGAGKSILASHVIDRYDSHANTQLGEGLAFFYFSKTDQETLDRPLLHVLQSFVRQLAVVSHQPQKIYAGLVEKCRDLDSRTRSFNAQLCKEMIADIVNDCPHTTLILDGLDEFPRDDLHGIITFLSQLAKNAKRPLKVFISSRNEPYIRTMLVGSQAKLKQVTIVDENHSDIQNFVEEQTNTIIEYFRATMEPEQTLILKRDIIKVIGEEAKGMFMWASLQLAQLKKCDTETQVRRRLGKLPKTLTETYNELYDVEDPESQKYLRRAVTWVMNAHQPLSTEEILAAVRLSQHHVGNVTQLKVDEERLTEPALEKICRFLVVKDPKGHWKFPHASVEEFFQDHENERLKGWIGGEAKIEVAKLSVLLLTSYDNWSDVQSSLEALFAPKSSPEALFAPKTPKSALQRYVGECWPGHVGEIRPNTQAYEQVASLLKHFFVAEDGTYRSSSEYQSWARFYKKVQRWKSNKIYPTDDMVPTENSLFSIVILGLFPMTKDWGVEFLDLNQLNEDGYHLLALAARYGQVETCEALIGFGADPNRICIPQHRPIGTSALNEAVDNCELACAECLLNNGADPNLEIGYRPLCLAIHHNDTKRIRFLLDHKADPNAVCMDCYWQGEFYAAGLGGGHYLDPSYKAGTDGDLAPGAREHTPLTLSMYLHCSLAVVKLFVDYGADVNADTGQWGGVMGVALCGYVSDEVVSYLIEKAGAEPHRMVSDIMRRKPLVYGPMIPGRGIVASYMIRNKYLTPNDFRSLADDKYLPKSFIRDIELEEARRAP